jgi:hypothetical protein
MVSDKSHVVSDALSYNGVPAEIIFHQALGKKLGIPVHEACVIHSLLYRARGRSPEERAKLFRDQPEERREILERMYEKFSSGDKYPLDF